MNEMLEEVLSGTSQPLSEGKKLIVGGDLVWYNIELPVHAHQASLEVEKCKFKLSGIFD